MPLINWSNDLSVSIGFIDDQHKKLVSLINELYDAMAARKGQEIIGKILNDLIAYTKTHFANEEKMMMTHGYPGYLAHKKLHDDLAQKVISMHQDFKSGKPVVTVELMQFLKDWLTQHIKGTDQKYSPFMASKKVA